MSLFNKTEVRSICQNLPDLILTHGVFSGKFVDDFVERRTEQANRTRCSDTQPGSEALTDKVQNRPGFGREDDELSETFPYVEILHA